MAYRIFFMNKIMIDCLLTQLDNGVPSKRNKEIRKRDTPHLRFRKRGVSHLSLT